MVGVLVWGPEVQTQVNNLIARAIERPINLSTLQALSGPMTDGMTASNPASVAIGDRYSLKLEVGFYVTFTIEEQPTCMCRHLSISSAEGKPPFAVVEFVLKQFKFINRLKDCIVWGETTLDKRLAINILEPVDGNLELLKKGQ